MVNERARRAWRRVVVTSALALAVAACGGSASARAPSSTAPRASAAAQAGAGNRTDLSSVVAKMERCMTAAGFTLAGPPVGYQPPEGMTVTPPDSSSGIESDPAYGKAWQQCATSSGLTQASGASRVPPADVLKSMNDGALKIADCIRGRGWTIGELQKDSRGLLNPPLDPPANLSRAQQARYVQDVQACVGSVFNGSGPNAPGVKQVNP